MSLSNVSVLLARLTNNWPVKVLSVALAIALVVVYRMTTLTSRVMTVPLTVETGAELIPAGEVPPSVRVTVRGEDEGVRMIAYGDLEAFADFSRHDAEGFFRAPVQIRRRGTALEAGPLEITASPSELSVTLERRITVTLPVVAPVHGSVAAGFDLLSHTVSPAQVSLTGPASVLTGLTGVSTSPVSLEGRSGDFTVAVTIVSPGPLVSMTGAGIAEFRGVVRQAVPTRTIDGLPVTVTGLAAGLAAVPAAPATAGVRIQGGREQVDAFVPAAGFLTADASAVTEPGTHVLPVTADLPPGLTLLSVYPETLTLEVEAEVEAEGVALVLPAWLP